MDFLLNGDEPGRTTILLVHGSGAPMDTPWMNNVAETLADEGFRVARFEFSYMAARRTGGSKRPPAKAETYAPEFLAAIEALSCDGPLIIGGKSMGGGSVANFRRECRTACQRTHLFCEGGELLEARFPIRCDLTFTNHVRGFDPSQRRSC